MLIIKTTHSLLRFCLIVYVIEGATKRRALGCAKFLPTLPGCCLTGPPFRGSLYITCQKCQLLNKYLTGCAGHPNTDRQLPGIPPELTQMFAKLMAPLTNAASLLPLGRNLPADENPERDDEDRGVEGHDERHGDSSEAAENTRTEEETRFGIKPQGEKMGML